MPNNKSLLKTLGLFVLLTVIYLIISIPFKVMEIIPGFTDIRPVLLLMPMYGIFFGLPGCFAFSVGNFIADILSESLKISSSAGFVANFLGPLIFYIFWNILYKKGFSLRSGKTLLIHVLLTVFSAVIQALIITPVVGIAYPDIDLTLFSVTVFLNGTVFPIALGIPLIIFMQEELGFQPKQHVRRDRKPKNGAAAEDVTIP